MLLMVLALVAAGQDTATIVPLVSVYAIAGFRLFPALQFVYHGASILRANTAVINALHEDLTGLASRENGAAPAKDRPERLPFRQGLELRDVSFAYPARHGSVLAGVNLTIPRGSFAAIIGETGAGKTTLVDILLGLLRPQTGKVLVDGVELDEESIGKWRSIIGYVPQHIYLTDDTIAANIAFGINDGELDREALERAARTANIHEFIVTELPEGYDTVVGEHGVRLSGGQRQRVAIARALYHDPEVLVLDEATSALDGSTENAVLEAIDKLAATKTLIVIAHRLTTVKKCDTVFLIGQGRVLARGRYDEVVTADGWTAATIDAKP
jgi:ABC-type multidrug transport system fused ATPase/permease subunit